MFKKKDIPVAAPVLHNPAFGLANFTGLCLSNRYDRIEARRFLSMLIVRDRLNLRAHMQRICLILVDHDEPDRLFGAVADLFLALGNKGQALRVTVLQLVKTQLKSADHDFLFASLASGLSRIGEHDVNGALLSNGVVASDLVVERQRASIAAPVEVDAVELAIQHLEDGDLEGARTLLEKALLDDPSNEVAETELLEIYRRSRDKQHIRAMSRALQAKGVKLSPAWQSLS